MRSKKAIAGLLAAYMVFALAGCGKENVQESQSSSAKEEKTVEQVASASSESSEEKKYEKKISIEIVENTETEGFDGFVAEILLEKLNAEVKTVKLPEYSQQLNIRLSGGNIPDIFLIPSRTAMTEMVKNGYLLDLTPYLDQLQTTVDFVSNGGGVMTSAVYQDGVWAIPKRETVNKALQQSGLMIRKDWLDNLGLPMPKNYEELLATGILRNMISS